MKKRNKGSERRKPVPPAIPPAPRLLGRLPRWLTEYKFLAIILGITLPLGVYEAFSDQLPKSSAQVPEEWLLDSRKNLAETLMDLYPSRSQGYFLRAYQAGMCWDRGFEPEVCASFPYKDLRDVRLALQAAIDRGGASDQEELFHFYAFTLLQFDESPEVIDMAIRNWRKNYPYSVKPDPRELPRANSNRGG